MSLSKNLWVTFPKPRADASLRIFCFPYAGGGASLFRPWVNALPDSFEICPVQLPGRENRFAENAFTHVDYIIPDLADAISVYLDKPFVFFGHSMGALVGFELARYLRQHSSKSPLHFLVSGHRAPQLPLAQEPIYNLPTDQFLKKLSMINGTLGDAFQDEELAQLLLPLLRADLTVSETYTYRTAPPLSCSLSVLGGLQDDSISHDELNAWKDQTTGTFALHMLPGDHFFLHSSQAAVLQILVKDLSPYLNYSARSSSNRDRHE